MLSTHDLEDMMMQDPVASSCFLGVFASNELPSKIPTYPSGLRVAKGGHVFPRRRGQGGIL